MTTASETLRGLTAFPTRIDLAALHAAYLAEGFTDGSTPRTLHNGYRRYTKDLGPDGHLHARVPALPEDDSDLLDYYEAIHEDARAALLFLVEETGNQHFECGPTSRRELALIEALNLLRTSTIADTCSCGNRFDGDNFCLPSACQEEE